MRMNQYRLFAGVQKGVLSVGSIFGFLLLVCFVWSGPAAAEGTTDGLKVQIARPSEGETFYSGESSLSYSMFVKGYVSLGGSDPAGYLAKTSVRLQVWQDGSLVDELLTQASKDGRFSFSLSVNAESSEGSFPPTLEPACIVCHFISNNHLPAGEVLLKVIASLPDGRQAIDERLVYSDRSGKLELPVRLILAGAEDQVVPGVMVQASTRLYDWRGRTFLAKSDEDGIAHLKLESLSQAPTQYIVRVNPVIVEGVRYASTAIEEITLEHGAVLPEMITLELTSELGSVTGKVEMPGGDQDASLSARLIHVPDGKFIETSLGAHGEYTFMDVPLGKYLVLAGVSETVSSQAWIGVPEQERLAFVNLSEDAHPEVALSVHKVAENILQGSVAASAAAEAEAEAEAEADVLPFVWVRTEQSGVSQAVDPRSGRFALFDLPAKTETLLVAAPGYYSRAVVVDPGRADAVLEPIALKRQETTQRIPWGSGEIVIPAESLVERGSSLILRSGWLFGRGDGGQAINLRAGEFSIDLKQGRFALEYLPNESAWFFMFEGEALVASAGGAPVQVFGGQMINLTVGDGFLPVQYDSQVVAVLRGLHQRSLPLSWEPTMVARMRDAASRLGVGAAQAITYIAYIFILVVLLAVPAYYLTRGFRNRKMEKPAEKTNREEVK